MTRTYKELTEEEKKEIINYYYSNKKQNFKQIRSYFNISQRTLPKILNEAGINTKLKNRYIIKNEDYFKYIDTEFKAYILGFIYADGFVGTHDDFCIALTDKVYDNYLILNKFKEELKTDNLVKHDDKGKYGKYIFKFSNKKIVSDLNKCGVYTCKSLNMKDIPHNIDQSLFRHFIRGYFDGDGCICPYYDNTDKRQRCTVEMLGTQEFLLQIQEIMINQCGINKTSLTSIKRVPGLMKMSYKGIKNILKIRDYFYDNATIYLTYKYEKFMNIKPL